MSKQVTGRITRILTQKSGCISKFEGKLEELNEYDSRILAWILLTRTPGLWMLEAFPKDSATRYGLSNILSAANVRLTGEFQIILWIEISYAGKF